MFEYINMYVCLHATISVTNLNLATDCAPLAPDNSRIASWSRESLSLVHHSASPLVQYCMFLPGSISRVCVGGWLIVLSACSAQHVGYQHELPVQ